MVFFIVVIDIVIVPQCALTLVIFYLRFDSYVTLYTLTINMRITCFIDTLTVTLTFYLTLISTLSWSTSTDKLWTVQIENPLYFLDNFFLIYFSVQHVV